MDKTITFKNLSLSIGGVRLINDCNLKFTQCHRYGIIGKNGVGKSVLLRSIASRNITESCGYARYPQNTNVIYVQQSVPENDQTPIGYLLSRENITIRELEEKISELEQLLETTDEIEIVSTELEQLYQELDQYKKNEKTRLAYLILTNLGFTKQDIDNKMLKEFSGGWRMRISIASALIYNPDFLILDEPNNHLDIKGIIWLESYLRDNWTNGLIVVSHDKNFLNELVDHIVEIKEQTLTQYTGNYDQYINLTRKKNKHVSDKSQKSPFKEVYQSEVPLVKVKDVTFGFDNPVIRQANFGIGTYSKIALVGENGIGKTTLLNIIDRKVEPQKGCLDIDPHCRVVKYNQFNSSDSTETVISYMERVYGLPKTELWKHLSKFRLNGDIPKKRICDLSGGQQTKFHLAKIAIENPTIILLDEPTNNLDMESIEMLKTALEKFEGGLLIVSHNQNIIDICNEIWTIQNGKVIRFEGSYPDYKDFILSNKL